MNKWLSAFVALTLLLPNLPTAQGDISQTCPSESRRHRAYGKRVDAKSCLTLVFRDELMKLTNMSHISAINRAAEYCNEFFKHGSLVMYVPTMFPLKELEQIDFTHLMLLSSNRSPWNSFLCLHQPYNNCEERTYQNCVYDEASNSCVWQYTYHKIIDAEQPYGNMCPSYDNLMAGKPCSSCQKCSKTEWTSWKEYTDSEGNRFKIHYRPMDNKPCHSCYTDTSVCCSEYEIIGKNHTETIQCFYGTRNFNSTSGACNCSSNATGEFCEISTFSSEGEKVRTSNTVLLGKYTHQQKHIYDGTLIYEFLLKWVTIILLVIIALVAVFMPCTQLVCNKKPIVPRRNVIARMPITRAEIKTAYSPGQETYLMDAMICFASPASRRRTLGRQRSISYINKGRQPIEGKGMRTATPSMRTKQQEVTMREGMENCSSATIDVKRRQRLNRRREQLLNQRKHRMRRLERNDPTLPRRRMRSQRRFFHYSM